MRKERLEHPFAPVYNGNSRVLILGTFPSVKSREQSFYYGHPQNRFWRVLAAVYQSSLPSTIPEKTAFLLVNGIAVWDVLASCEIAGSADSTIAKPTPNAVLPLLEETKITKIYTNGKKSKTLYDKYLLPRTKIEATALPSTSPANAAWSLEKLILQWQDILK